MNAIQAVIRAEAQARIRVMVVDDSAIIRGLISKMLTNEADIEVVASAPNGHAAVQQAARTKLDVVVLDIEMPVMDGLTALPGLLAAQPSLSIIMASTLTQRNAEVSLKALSLGALDYVPKPLAAVGANEEFRRDLIRKVRALGTRQRRQPAPVAVTRATPAAPHTPVQMRAATTLRPQVLAIGSSTGGPQALLSMVKELPRTLDVPVVITQHMPPTFTAILAENIGRASGMPSKEAADGDRLMPGHIYVAPGARHLVFAEADGAITCRLTQDPPENYCRPAVDPMLRSLVRIYGQRILTVILTGMGQDGLEGCKAVVAAGGTVVAQDEASSVVWGMPRAVAEAGLCAAVLPLSQIGAHISSAFLRSGS